MPVKIIKEKPQAPSKFLIIGEPFGGKTTLASKAPKPLFISTDGNAAKMGLDSINVKNVVDVREAIEYVIKDKDYKTVVIDTIEGIADIFTEAIIDEFTGQGFRLPKGEKMQSLADVPYGRATGMLNKRIQAFANALAAMKKNVIILSYSKRQLDDVTGSIILASELKNIRLITRFMDAQVLANYDGEKHKANIIAKREAMAGKAEASAELKPFLNAIGWEMPKRSVKVGSTNNKGGKK